MSESKGNGISDSRTQHRAALSCGTLVPMQIVCICSLFCSLNVDTSVSLFQCHASANGRKHNQPKISACVMPALDVQRAHKSYMHSLICINRCMPASLRCAPAPDQLEMAWAQRGCSTSTHRNGELAAAPAGAGLIQCRRQATMAIATCLDCGT